MMYRWLPVGHNWQKCNLETDRCPCCGEPDETFQHLLQCGNEALGKARTQAYLLFQKRSTDWPLSLQFSITFLGVIKSILDKDCQITEPTIQSLVQAIRDQREIGIYNMVVGFVASSWTTAHEELGCDDAKGTMEQLLAFIWGNICERLWKARNNIKYSKNNCIAMDKMSTLADRLKWFRHHQDQVLDHRHRFLTNFSDNDVDRWSRDTRKAQLKVLTNAREFY